MVFAPADCSANQASLFKHPYVLGHGRKRHREWSCEVGHLVLAWPQLIQDSASHGM